MFTQQMVSTEDLRINHPHSHLRLLSLLRLIHQLPGRSVPQKDRPLVQGLIELKFSILGRSKSLPDALAIRLWADGRNFRLNRFSTPAMF